MTWELQLTTVRAGAVLNFVRVIFSTDFQGFSHRVEAKETQRFDGSSLTLALFTAPVSCQIEWAALPRRIPVGSWSA